MSKIHRKILGVDELAAVREQLRSSGKVVVQCHGCFDIVHPGHIRYLSFAKEQGDILIVTVTGDKEVGKGVDRPYINENLRAENVAAFEFVDYVCVDHNDWAGPILERLEPDIYVKGKEYEQKADPRFLREKELVERQGGKVIFSSGDVIYSSTSIINQFRGRFQLEHEQIRSFCRRHEISRGSLDALIRKFHDLRVLIVADPIIDRYIHCDALGIAAESPVISVMPLRQDTYAGAGALIALQMVILGARAALLTLMTDDAESREFATRLTSHGVEVIAVHADERPIFTKTRYLVDDKKVFKVDSGHHAPPSTAAIEEVRRILNGRLSEFDAVLAADFGYGLFSSEVIETITSLSDQQGKPYYVDVSNSRHANILRFPHPRLATPTEQELRFALADNEAGLSNLASRYYQESHAQQLVMTLGKRGVLIFDRPETQGARIPTDFLPALSQNAMDTIGAGDVFLAALALSDLAGGSTAAGVFLGSCLSAIHISRLGNDPVDGAEIHPYLDQRQELG